jgi:hypothetical protein
MIATSFDAILLPESANIPAEGSGGL